MLAQGNRTILILVDPLEIFLGEGRKFLKKEFTVPVYVPIEKSCFCPVDGFVSR